MTPSVWEQLLTIWTLFRFYDDNSDDFGMVDLRLHMNNWCSVDNSSDSLAGRLVSRVSNSSVLIANLTILKRFLSHGTIYDDFGIVHLRLHMSNLGSVHNSSYSLADGFVSKGANQSVLIASPMILQQFRSHDTTSDNFGMVHLRLHMRIELQLTIVLRLWHVDLYPRDEIRVFRIDFRVLDINSNDSKWIPLAWQHFRVWERQLASQRLQLW